MIDAELNDGEQITWIGAPIARRFAMKSIPIVLFGIPWTAAALFWMALTCGFEMPNFNFKDGFDVFPLFGIPFVFIGLEMLSSPLRMIRKAKKTAYVLTTVRAIVFDGGSATTIHSFGPERLTDLQRNQRPDGSGDLIFEYKPSNDSDDAAHGFLEISNVKAVEDMVRHLVETSPQKRP